MLRFFLKVPKLVFYNKNSIVVYYFKDKVAGFRFLKLNVLLHVHSQAMFRATSKKNITSLTKYQNLYFMSTMPSFCTILNINVPSADF